MVTADIRLIERVLVNLLDNAVRHTPDGGKLSVLCHPEGESIRVRVSDTGLGISADELSHIFETFLSRTSTGGSVG